MSVIGQLRFVKIALLLVFGVPSMLCVGGAIVSETFWGEATVPVLAPMDSELVLQIGDAHSETIPAGEHRAVGGRSERASQVTEWTWEGSPNRPGLQGGVLRVQRDLRCSSTKARSAE